MILEERTVQCRCVPVNSSLSENKGVAEVWIAYSATSHALEIISYEFEWLALPTGATRAVEHRYRPHSERRLFSVPYAVRVAAIASLRSRRHCYLPAAICAGR